MRVAVVGASGLVGRELVKILEERKKISISSLSLFSSHRNAGKTTTFHGDTIAYQELKSEEAFHGFDLIFFTAGSQVSAEFIPRAIKAGSLIIDNSSFFRLEKSVPLIVPEVNANVLLPKPNQLIANPNCTTIQLVVALKPILDRYEIKHVVLTSFQAVSGKGYFGIEEFKQQVHHFVDQNATPSKTEVFHYPIAFNCIPHIDGFQSDGFTGEEHKVMNETRKILAQPDLKISATCVRVPVWNGHSESVHIQTKKPVIIDELRELLRQAPGIKLEDAPQDNVYPLAIRAAGKDDVFIGRIRKDPSIDNNCGLLLWIVADNLRKGAALNAVQIAELCCK